MRTLALGALAAFALAAGCGGDDAPPTLADHLAADAEVVIARSLREAPAATVLEVEAVLPFAPVLPRYVPLDAELTRVWAGVPADGADELGRRSDSRAQLVYSNEHSRPQGPRVHLVIEERLASFGIEGARTEEIRIGDGIRAELMHSSAGRPQFVSIAWPACGIGVVLTAELTGGMDEAEAIRIAESTLDSCPVAADGSG